MKKWNFVDQPDTACVTSSDVTDGVRAILYASHEVDEDGEVVWQFHSDPDNFDFEKAKLVRLDTMVKIDPSLIELAKLPVGVFATRTDVGSPWEQHALGE